LLDITQDHTPLMRQTVEKIISIMGKERNYGEFGHDHIIVL